MSAPAEIARSRPHPHLRAGALHLIETVGQPLAAIAPTLTPALNISVVAGLAGLGCWMSYFIGTLGVVIVAASVGVLASRHPEAGSYFVYIGRGFGPLAGKVFRIGVMGPLATEDNVQFFLKEFGKALKAEGYSA